MFVWWLNKLPRKWTTSFDHFLSRLPSRRRPDENKVFRFIRALMNEISFSRSMLHCGIRNIQQTNINILHNVQLVLFLSFNYCERRETQIHSSLEGKYLMCVRSIRMFGVNSSVKCCCLFGWYRERGSHQIKKLERAKPHNKQKRNARLCVIRYSLVSEYTLAIHCDANGSPKQTMKNCV